MRYVEKYCSAKGIKDENTLRCMHFACWVTQATNPHLDYVILTAFARQQRLREGASMIVYMYTASLLHMCF
jgi:hypothetical protein